MSNTKTTVNILKTSFVCFNKLIKSETSLSIQHLTTTMMRRKSETCNLGMFIENFLLLKYNQAETGLGAFFGLGLNLSKTLAGSEGPLLLLPAGANMVILLFFVSSMNSWKIKALDKIT
jgi:hypothetical protein